jgi:hypothetical protein
VKTAICVAGYNRPEYLAKCLASLEKNPESQTLPFYFYLDGGHGSCVKANQELIEKSNIKTKHVIARGSWYGLGRNLIDVRRQTFDVLGFDRMIFFEEDMVVTPQYISLVQNLADWAFKHGDVATVQASPRCYLDKEAKIAASQHVKSGMEIFSGYAMERSCWEVINTALFAYEKLFLMDRPYRARNHASIRRWMGENLFGRDKRVSRQPALCKGERPRWFNPAALNNWTTSQDGITAMAMWCAGYNYRFTTKVNRAVHIGVRGENSRPGYHAKHWAPMKLEEMPGDETRTEFQWMG